MQLLAHRALDEKLPQAARLCPGRSDRPGELLFAQMHHLGRAGGGAKSPAGRRRVPIAVMARSDGQRHPDAHLVADGYRDDQILSRDPLPFAGGQDGGEDGARGVEDRFPVQVVHFDDV